MQNKPNLTAAKMNVTNVLTKDYENDHSTDPPKTNPIYRRAASRLRESAIAASAEALGEAGTKPISIPKPPPIIYNWAKINCFGHLNFCHLILFRF